jgi:glycosyltransferase involved in cell wall biosynthesis
MAKKILIISEFGCGPPYYGNRTRMRTLIAELRALGYTIDFAGVRFSPEEKAATIPHIDRWVHSFDEPAVAFFWRRRKWAIKQRLRRMQSRNVAETDDIANLDRWFNPAWLDEARKLQAREDYRNVMVAYVFHSIFLEAFPDPCRRILEAQDTFAARHEKVEAAGIARYWFSCSEGEERMGLERAHVVLAIQDEEADVFRRQLRGKSEVRVVGHFVEPCEVAENPGAAQRIGYIGAYNPLNLQGLQWFIREVWPTVWREFPAARLVVAGSICDKLKPGPGLELLGKVRDAAQAHADFLVSLNPMPSGTGLKIKTVEAMACGRPVVATPAGCAGLRAYLGQGLVEAKDTDSFAEAVLTWVRNPDEARRQGRLARAAMEELNQRSSKELEATFSGLP